MFQTANGPYKELKLENEELKHLLLKLTSKYKTSEIKRNVLLKRNAMLITDNKNLHLQILEITKQKLISEKTVVTYQKAVKILKNELNQLKAETSLRGDQNDVKSEPKSVFSMVSDKLLQSNNESEQYYEVSDESVRGGRAYSTRSCDTPTQSFADGYMSDDLLTETEPISATKGSQKDDYGMCPEVEAYYQVADKNFQIRPEEFSNASTHKKTESVTSYDSKKEDKAPFEQKSDRLWAQIKELKQMTKVTDEELQTRRNAIAAKSEMIQNVQEEIKRMQNLLSLAKQ